MASVGLLPKKQPPFQTVEWGAPHFSGAGYPSAGNPPAELAPHLMRGWVGVGLANIPAPYLIRGRILPCHQNSPLFMAENFNHRLDHPARLILNSTICACM